MREFAKEKIRSVYDSAQIEQEIAELDDDEKKMFWKIWDLLSGLEKRSCQPSHSWFD
ncbi:MAG: hypothetical protein ACLSD6_03190 [Clostridium sp.]